MSIDHQDDLAYTQSYVNNNIGDQGGVMHMDNYRHVSIPERHGFDQA